MRDIHDPHPDEEQTSPIPISPKESSLCPFEGPKFWIDWYYYFGKAGYVLKIIHSLQSLQQCHGLNIQFMTILHQPQGWIIRIRPNQSWPIQSILDFQALLNEFGFTYKPNQHFRQIFDALEKGESLMDVMSRYCISAINHGQPRTDEILMFREKVIEGLGYCPDALM